ncbi:hypothetical protein C8R44DRAFT_742121 [Mycena epipterygia]|nr:hypothetical protein C8R44DRAFT_742121 [Mycena epipterygia]
MAKTATVTKTKTATKEANTKTKDTKSKAKTNADGTEKPKRAPSAYNTFVSINLKKWHEENPDIPRTQGMSAVAALWADAPENPKRGQPVTKRAPKVKAAKDDTKKKAAPKSKSKVKPKKKAESEEEEEEEDAEDEKENENEIQSSDD